MFQTKIKMKYSDMVKQIVEEYAPALYEALKDGFNNGCQIEGCECKEITCYLTKKTTHKHLIELELDIVSSMFENDNINVSYTIEEIGLNEYRIGVSNH